MLIYDAAGEVLDPTSLEAGDLFYDENGDEYVAVTHHQLCELEITECASTSMPRS